MSNEDTTERASKAAIILLALGGTLGSQLMQEFDPDEIRQFADSAAALNEIDPELLEGLIEEFSSEMDRPVPMRGGGDRARAFLAEALPAEQVNKILGAEGAPFVPIWQNFTPGTENTLVPYLLDEHPQTVAFVLTKLDTEVSAKTVSLLPRELRDSVTRRLLKMQPVEAEPNKLVQQCLQADLLTQADTMLEKEGRARMATLLNRLDKEQVEMILDGLRTERPVEAAALKKLLFSFEDLPKLDQKHRLVLFDKVQTELVMVALRGAEGELKETVLASLGARARRMIEAELTDADATVSKEVIAARQSIAEVALKLAASGEISIDEPETDASAEAAA